MRHSSHYWRYACLTRTTNPGAVAYRCPYAQTPRGHFKVGPGGVQAANWLVTVSKITTSDGSQYVKPKNGNRFLVVTVSLQNTSRQTQNLSSFQFELRDANGFRYTDIYFDGARPSPNGTVEPSGLLSGDLTYEVPHVMHRFTFLFEPVAGLTYQVIWDIAV